MHSKWQQVSCPSLFLWLLVLVLSEQTHSSILSNLRHSAYNKRKWTDNSCLGCTIDIHRENAQLSKVAAKTASLLENYFKSSRTLKTTRIISASKQKLSDEDTRYYLTLEVGETVCSRPPASFTVCPLLASGRRRVFYVIVRSTPARGRWKIVLLKPLNVGGTVVVGGVDERTVTSLSQLNVETKVDHNPTSSAASVDRKYSQSSSAFTDGITVFSGALSIEPETPTTGIEDNRGARSVRSASREEDDPVQDAEHVANTDTESSEPSARTQSSAAEQHNDAELVHDVLSSCCSCRTARQAVTREVHVNVNHPEVQQLLVQFLENQERQGSRRLVITDVISAIQQVASEVSYQFEFIMGPSDCEKNSTKNRYSCYVSDNSQLSSCRVRVLTRHGVAAMFNSVSCISNSQLDGCHDNDAPCRATKRLPYAPVYTRSASHATPLDIHDQRYLQMMSHVQSELNRRSRRPMFYRYFRTVEAAKHKALSADDLVDQEMYNLKLRFFLTKCEKNRDENGAVCVQKSGYESGALTTICDVRMSSLPWANRMRVLDMFCENEPSDAK